MARQPRSREAAAEAVGDASSVIKIKLVRSPIGCNQRQRETVRSLGLRKLHQVVEQVDTPVTRGMVEKVKHLVQVLGE